MIVCCLLLLGSLFGVRSDLVYLPYMEDGEDLLSMYDGTADRYLGIKVSGPDSLEAVKQDLSGGWAIEEHVVHSESDYSGSFSLSAEGQANILLRFISGNLRLQFSVQKFGAVQANTVIGLVVIERKTREDFIDPCASAVYENVYEYSSYPNNLNPTHVVVRKKYKLRVELAFKFKNKLSSQHEYSTRDFGIKLEDALGTFVLNARANGTRKSNSEELLEEASVIIKSNGNIPMKSVQDFATRQELVQYLIKHVQNSIDIGSLTEVGLEDFSTFSVCLALRGNHRQYTYFHSSHTAILQDVSKRLQLSKIKDEELYADFDTFRDCFNQTVSEDFLRRKTVHDLELTPLYSRLIVASSKFKNGTFTETDFLTVINSVSEKLSQININRFNNKSNVLDSVVSLYKELERNEISCWPVEKQQIFLGTQYKDKIVRFFAAEFTNGRTLTSKQQLDLNNFSLQCSSHAEWKCHIMDCAYFQTACENINGSGIIEFDTRQNPNSAEKPDKFTDAIVFNYKKSMAFEFLLKNIMVNVEALKDGLLDLGGKNRTEFINLRKLIQLFEPAEENFTNPIETLIGKPLVIIP